jgi:hypothetical protein
LRTGAFLFLRKRLSHIKSAKAEKAPERIFCWILPWFLYWSGPFPELYHASLQKYGQCEVLASLFQMSLACSLSGLCSPLTVVKASRVCGPSFFLASHQLLELPVRPWRKLSAPRKLLVEPPKLSTWGLELFFSCKKGCHTSNQQRILREILFKSCPGFCTEVGLFQSSTMQVCKSMDSVRC